MRLPLALLTDVRLLNSGFRIGHWIHNGVTKTSLLSSCNICSRAERKWIKPVGFDTGVKTYNSLTKQKEPLVLAQERIATWYSCGPTVYDHAHLGHACSYVRFDILQRILSRLFEINVIHVMVITDIDDKIIQRSLENISPTVLARMHEEEFKRDMQALRVLPPAVYMRVTDNIPQIVAFIERIIGNGHGYVTSQGNVYFDTQSIGNRYGKLVNLGGIVGELGAQDKRDPRDFALWKASKPHEPHWESPWGQGRPGWHIECSTIASSVFGSQLDIHSGGIDLAFPHHENEIAQSEAYHQCEQWGNYFLHSGHLHLKGSVEKMSKSLKNYVTINDFLESYTANEFRLFCLLTRYRSAIDYSDASTNEARSTLSTISAFCHNAQAYMQGHLLCQPIEEGILWERLSATQSSVRKALADDFDTPKAVGAIMSLIHHGNCQLQPATKVDGPRCPAVFGAMLSYVREILGVFGVDLLDRKEVHDSSGVLNNVVEELVHFRSKVRKFALSVGDQASQNPQTGSEIQKRHPQPDRVPLLKACDALRNNLAPLGVHIKDRGTNSTWEITRGGETRKN
ncbi:probable cysteine--tRNA ligase, mitochondrial isoform X2 [Sinocyclocheilus rhinocerous]|uniref:probable cysteine--tRNA ligase, mitochondrial isoform X2 n=1 Tax=Sinocyclocheilus rhinocerous TaxID=307959 RepID=UPI0007B84F74|nr:PREDICTED: probable cysteine--tRNA ligase, mitochondrial isoform X2 [Sinocyclocheilus rhinocerous]